MARRKPKTEIESELEAVLEEDTSNELDLTRDLLKSENILSTGNTMLNLSCTDTVDGGLLAGKYYLFVGQPGAGKTWVSMSVFAESGLHPKFKEYNLFYDDVEAGANMDLEKYFGKKTVERIQPPNPGRIDSLGMPQESSRTVEQFYDSVEQKLEEAESEGTGIIYILDSMDALTTESSLAKDKEDRRKREQGKEASGSYGDGKAKINAQRLRNVVGRLEKTKSILVIICQEKVDITSAFKAKTFSGGVALTFYSTLQVWFQVRSKIEKTIEGNKRDLGTLTRVKVERNRLTGKRHRDIEMPIYYNFGIDDVGAMINWLVEENHWKAAKSEMAKIPAEEFGETGLTREKLARHIEDNDLEKKLRKIVFKKWKRIQKKISEKVVRKSKYE